MATEDYTTRNNGNERGYHNSYDNDMHHMRRDVRDAHTNSQLAKWLAVLATLLAAVALITAIIALNKAGDAQSTANRATEQVQSINR